MNEELRVLDLFSGIGGFALGLRRAGGFRTVAYCEIESYCQEVLKARMRDGSLDTAPVCRDVRRLDGRALAGLVDVICGGFPCQDISWAGTGDGLQGERSGLWRDYARLIREIRPLYVIVENVDALLVRGLDAVLGDLASLGYDAEWRVFSSCVFGATHCRERLWIVAYAGGIGEEGFVRPGGLLGVDRPRWEASQASLRHWRGTWASGAFGQGEAAAVVLGEDDAVPHRLDRIKALGNSIIPDIVEWIGRRIRESGD